MRTFMRVGLWAIVVGSVLSMAVASGLAQAAGTRRFALVIGANDGGKERTVLRYAQRDARAMATVLEQLGGVESRDRVMLLEPTPQQLTTALADLRERAMAARQQGERTELLFYYSGHSDERGLLLGRERVAYRELRDGLSSVGAAVHVGVLDSCASGALTRIKGGKRRAPFLLDTSNEVHGHAFLTSSSADEGAQESDRVGASFFTHFLVSGLRGAADFSGDGRVTLNEAYRFAFDETLASTADTHAGPQHAAYDIQLVGTGDLVMTDLSRPAAALQIPKQISGRLYVRDTQGNLVVELNKPAGRMVELALDVQAYQILLDRDGSLSRTEVKLAANTTTVLQSSAFVSVQGARHRLRGDEAEPEGDVRVVPFGVGLVPPASTNSRYRHVPGSSAFRIKNQVAFHFGWGRSHQLEGFALALGGNQQLEYVEGVQLAVGVNLTDRLEGVQLGVGANVAEDVDGLQLGASLNLAQGELQGAQLGLVNVVAAIDGVQAGLINVGTQRQLGVQAGLVNVAGVLSGLQAGLINVAAAPRTEGLQLGLVSVASGHLRGAQIGLVNYADRADAQLGLLSGTREGGVHPLLYVAHPIAVQLGLRLDADYTYGALIGGVDTDAVENVYAVGLAFGTKIPLHEKLWLEPELSGQMLGFGKSFRGEETSTLGRLALNLRYEFYRHLSVFAGPSFNAIVHAAQENHDREIGFIRGHWELTAPDSPTQVLGSIGFQIGASL